MHTSKLPDLVKEIVDNKAKVKEKENNDQSKEEADINIDESGMVKKRITLFEKKFCQL